jgi:hypothetical protein
VRSLTPYCLRYQSELRKRAAAVHCLRTSRVARLSTTSTTSEFTLCPCLRLFDPRGPSHQSESCMADGSQPSPASSTSPSQRPWKPETGHAGQSARELYQSAEKTFLNFYRDYTPVSKSSSNTLTPEGCNPSKCQHNDVLQYLDGVEALAQNLSRIESRPVPGNRNFPSLPKLPIMPGSAAPSPRATRS